MFAAALDRLMLNEESLRDLFELYASPIRVNPSSSRGVGTS